MIKIKINEQKKKEFIQYRVSNDVAWAMATLKKLYNRQTNEEHKKVETIEHNEKGFSKPDAAPLSRLYEAFVKERKSGEPTEDAFDRIFTKANQNVIKNKMKKYWKQVLSIVDEDTMTIEILEREIEILKANKLPDENGQLSLSL